MNTTTVQDAKPDATVPPLSETESKLKAEIENINKEIGTLKEKNNELMVGTGCYRYINCSSHCNYIC